MTNFVTIRHQQLPEINPDSEIFFEFIIFFQSLIVLGCQYLNLYKTAWWMPYSTANYAINFSLVDFDLTMFLIIIMSRRLLYSIYKQPSPQPPGMKKKSLSSLCFYYIAVIAKLVLISKVFIAFIYFSCKIISTTSFITSLFLVYPMITYLFLFKLNFKPLFGKLSPVKSKYMHGKHNKYKGTYDSPLHICSSSPEEVRNEAELLRSDFNSRVSQVLFNSMFSCYYSVCVPLCFSQSTLYYNPWWTGQLMVLVWLGFLSLFANHFLSISYLDTLHRCSCHLGNWSKIDSKNSPHTVFTAWSELQLWVQDSTVKHVKGLFRARGISNAAEPGNSMHERFYRIFNKPKRMTNVMLWSTSFLVGNEFLNLLWTSHWDNLFTLVLLIFPNYYVLFKQNRNKLILDKIYK